MNHKSPTHVSTDYVPEDYKESFTENKKYKVEATGIITAWIKDDKGEENCVKFKKGGSISQYCNLLGEGKLWIPHYEE